MIKLQGQSQIILKDEVLDVFREGCITYVDGKPVKGELFKDKFRGNVQPMNGRDLLLVPEGDRFKEQYWIFTTYPLLVNDRVVRCSVNFQTQTVETWGSYFRARIMRIDVGPYSVGQ